MNIKIGFDPGKLQECDEAYPAFQEGGMALKLWALYKRHFITNQHFRPALVKFAEYIRQADDPLIKDIAWYRNIDDFVLVLKDVGILQRGPWLRPEMLSWLTEHWDHFNPNIHRRIVIEFEVLRPVIETIEVGGIKRD